MPTLYNNNIRIVQAPGYVAIVHEMVHETRVVPLDGSPFSNVRSYIGRVARPLGRRHARRRDAQLQRQGAVSRRDDEPARHRALHARRRRQGRLQGHVRGRHAVDAAVDGRVHDAHGRRRALRVRVPRRQLRPAQHPRERARRRAQSRGGASSSEARDAIRALASAAALLRRRQRAAGSASLVRGRVRCEPARDAEGHDHEDGVDQSALAGCTST